MTRASTPCPTPRCPHLQPCPDHPTKTHGWDTSTRTQHLTVSSGWEEQRRARRILRTHRYLCHVCSKPGADTVDHVIPLSQGGPDTEANLKPIHSLPCHKLKTQAEARAGRGGV